MGKDVQVTHMKKEVEKYIAVNKEVLVNELQMARR